MSKRSCGIVDRDLGLRVHQARLMRGWSQTDLGTALGVTFQQVQKYEKGTNRISCSQLVHIAAALALPVTWFFPAAAKAPIVAGRAAEPDPGQELAASRDGLRLARAFNAVADRRIRAGILAIAEASAPAPAARRKAA